MNVDVILPTDAGKGLRELRDKYVIEPGAPYQDNKNQSQENRMTVPFPKALGFLFPSRDLLLRSPSSLAASC